MTLLLDTHTFLWFILNSPSLGTSARELIEDAETVFLSLASVWEMAVKVSIGKLLLPQPLEQFIPQQLQHNGVALLPIALSHAIRVSNLPFHHRDPFDRLLIAQSLVENVPIVVSVDVAFDAYGVRRLW